MKTRIMKSLIGILCLTGVMALTALPANAQTQETRTFSRSGVGERN